MLRFFSLTALLFVPAFAACSVATDAPVPGAELPGSRISEEALKGGCRVVCPKCKPFQPCPQYPCTIECPPKVTPCGDTVCTGGKVCCNASCGICTEPDMFCTQQACEPAGCTMIALCVEGYSWDSEQCACTPVAAECQVDADCQLADDYCGGCNCIALGPSESAPVCKDPVQCFAQPCGFGQTAACVGGQCVVQ
jgi:hypothetical protein